MFTYIIPEGLVYQPHVIYHMIFPQRVINVLCTYCTFLWAKGIKGQPKASSMKYTPTFAKTRKCHILFRTI